MPLLDNVYVFVLSPDEGKIVYETLEEKICLYDVKTKESVFLTKTRDYMGAPVMFSESGDFVFYSQCKSGEIDRASMYKFFIIDLESRTVMECKDWKREARFYGADW